MGVVTSWRPSMRCTLNEAMLVAPCGCTVGVDGQGGVVESRQLQAASNPEETSSVVVDGPFEAAGEGGHDAAERRLLRPADFGGGELYLAEVLPFGLAGEVRAGFGVVPLVTLVQAGAADADLVGLGAGRRAAAGGPLLHDMVA